MSINGLAPGTILRGEKYEYEIRKVLGSGSFGITYVAMMRSDDGSLPVAVAIKEFFMREINGRDGSTVSNSSANNVFGYYKKKFIKEALSLGRLNHPGIIKVIESFEANNTCYYSMEYIRGGSLDDLIERKGSLGEQETVALAGKIGEALEYMHFKNMVHLDLKPGNIMMRDDRTPVLIDFGLSKKFDADGHAETSTTLGCGTPGYAPIEQATQQKTDELPVTMDIYAFGATLFKMLTGKRPPESSSILNDGFPSASLRQSGVSGRLIKDIEKSMSPSKKNRFQSIRAMVTAIRPPEKKSEKTIIGTQNNPSENKHTTATKQSDKGKDVSNWIYVNVILAGIFGLSGTCSIYRQNTGLATNENAGIAFPFLVLAFGLFIVYINKPIKNLLYVATIILTLSTIVACVDSYHPDDLWFGLILAVVEFVVSAIVLYKKK